MALDLAFRFPLAGGLHARPAAALRLQALGRACTWVNEASGQRAALDDLLALLATDTHEGDPCRILADGPGAAATLADLEAYLQGPFLALDEPPPAALGQAGSIVPALLAQAGATWWAGVAVAPGVGCGPVVLLAAPAPASGAGAGPTDDPEGELLALRGALGALGAQLAQEAAAAAHPVQRAVLEAHGAMLQDSVWGAAMEAHIRHGLMTAPTAVRAGAEAFSGQLRASSSPYLRERALDVEDLAERLAGALQPTPPPSPAPLTAPAVLVARDLAPSRFLALDHTLLRGLVLTGGSRTSHTAILARSFGIPAVAGLTAPLHAGQTILVDGGRGLVIPDPPERLLAYYRAEAGPRREAAAASEPTVALRANILTPREVPGAMAAGAEGVGLYRTEMLFLDRPAPPDEEEQVTAYREALTAAQGRPVVLRLLDVGGDKPLPYLPLPVEANPFLGCRGVRLYPLHPGLIRTQVRAALRAGTAGALRLMVPMVAEAEELQAVRALVASCAGELAREGLEHVAAPPLGIMVEVPAAVFNLDALAPDFFCVGTNDLVQYLFAADRGDPAVAKASHDWHPATLRALAAVVQGGRRLGLPVSLCGELAGRTRLLPLLLGLGYRELSMAPPLLGAAQAALANLDLAACEALAAAALAAGTAGEVEALLMAHPCARPVGPLLDADLVLLDAVCQSKEEAIKVLVERLAAKGRTLDPLAVEEAVWARERQYATGVGFGFAVPHCKCEAATPSLAVLRLRQGLDWGALDGAPVDTVLLLTMGAGDGDEHLRVFARLARKLVAPAFRAALKDAPTPEALLAHLSAHLF
jgi:fructose-specific PTS system IIA-like component